MASITEFENHIWKDLYSEQDFKLYSHYARETRVGPAPALLLIDFYNECFRGGAKHPYELSDQYPSSCGLYAHRLIEPTKRLIAASRRAGIPIFYSTGEDRPFSKFVSRSGSAKVTHRRSTGKQPDDYEIFPDLAPEPGDVVIHKQRASCFYGTPLLLQLHSLGIRSLIVGGGTASGCLRAGVMDAQSAGFHVSVVEECVFDRADVPLKSNLFDLGHKYVDVMHVDEVVTHLTMMAPAQAAE
jgi:nicotinamidase-related amidase